MSDRGRGSGGPPGRPPRDSGVTGPVPPAARDQVDELAARAGLPDEDVEAPPPVGGSWQRLYTGVVLTLILYILAFWLFTRAYAP